MAGTPINQPPTPSARPDMSRAITGHTGLYAAMLVTLVHKFYDRVRADSALTPILVDRITDWPPKAAGHLVERAVRITQSLHMAVDDHSPSENSVKEHYDDRNSPTQDPSALTRYIEIRDHACLREQLPQLAHMAERVESVHFGDDNVPEGQSDMLTKMMGEMEVHMKKKLVLFPAIHKGGMLGIGDPIAAMRADYAAEVAEIGRLTGGPSLPKGACGTWTALYDGLGELLTDFEKHMRLENDVLLPKFEPQ